MKVDQRHALAAIVTPLSIPIIYVLASLIFRHVTHDNAGSVGERMYKMANIDAALGVMLYVSTLIVSVLVYAALGFARRLYAIDVIAIYISIGAIVAVVLFYAVHFSILGSALVVPLLGVCSVVFSALAGVPLSRPKSA